MPVLDAKALKTDPEGVAFLRAVLGDRSATGSENRKAGRNKRPEPQARTEAPVPPTGRRSSPGRI